MKILGIDYGKSKVGIAFADGPLAEPVEVVHYSSSEELEKKINELAEKYGAEKIVVGVSEGEIGRQSQEFADLINAETFDETLSTQDAQRMSREAGIPQRKRREMEDAYAAAVMLQGYLDKLS
jgi:putative Holliday junction resolvase